MRGPVQCAYEANQLGVGQFVPVKGLINFNEIKAFIKFSTSDNAFLVL